MGNERLSDQKSALSKVDHDASSELILKSVPCCTQSQTNVNAMFQFLSCRFSVDS